MSSLTYENARDSIKDGDVIFFYGDKRNIFSRAIMHATSSKFSHAAVAFWISTAYTKRLMIAESVDIAGRRIVNLSIYRNRPMEVISAPTDWSNVCDTALERLGVEQYNMFEAVLIGAKDRIRNLTGYKIKFNDLPGEVCSQFVAKVYNLPDIEISPQDLYDTLIYKYNCKSKLTVNG